MSYYTYNYNEYNHIWRTPNAYPYSLVFLESCAMALDSNIWQQGHAFLHMLNVPWVKNIILHQSCSPLLPPQHCCQIISFISVRAWDNYSDQRWRIDDHCIQTRNMCMQQTLAHCSKTSPENPSNIDNFSKLSKRKIILTITGRDHAIKTIFGHKY